MQVVVYDDRRSMNYNFVFVNVQYGNIRMCFGSISPLVFTLLNNAFLGANVARQKMFFRYLHIFNFLNSRHETYKCKKETIYLQIYLYC